MKPLAALALALLAFAPVLHAGSLAIPVKATGTFTYQGVDENDAPKPIVRKLDNATILDDFGLDSSTHDVVFDAGQLVLRPKQPGEDVVIIATVTESTVRRAKPPTETFSGSSSSTANSKVFGGYTGAFTGTSKVIGKKFRVSLSFVGYNFGILKLKISGSTKAQNPS